MQMHHTEQKKVELMTKLGNASLVLNKVPTDLITNAALKPGK